MYVINNIIIYYIICYNILYYKYNMLYYYKISMPKNNNIPKYTCFILYNKNKSSNYCLNFTYNNKLLFFYYY